MTGTGLLHAIDFGTSNSAIVVSRPDGTVTTVGDPVGPVGARSVRTSICVLPDGRVVVGQEAENAKGLYGDAYRSEFKRDFGKSAVTTPGGQPMTADGMAVEVVRFLKAQAMAKVPEEPERVVVTIPASWEAGNRKLMRSVVRRAGYRDAEIDLVHEPVAAAAYAFSDYPSATQRLTVLVYDLGGGTFDCAVARGDAGWYDVFGHPDGKGNIGGAAFDNLLLGLIAERFCNAMPPPLTGEDDDADVIRRWLGLKDTCEEIKQRLSVDERAGEDLTELVPPARFEVTRAEFEAKIGPLLAETLLICDRLVKEQLAMDWRDVDRIVPVGGSSWIPLTGRLLAERCGRPVLTVEAPDMAVVLGAAIIGRREYAEAAPRRIFVNGLKKVIDRPEIGYGDIVTLALGQPPTGPYVTLTVTYVQGPRGMSAGSLFEGDSVRVESGMVFNVTATDRS